MKKKTYKLTEWDNKEAGTVSDGYTLTSIHYDGVNKQVTELWEKVLITKKADIPKRCKICDVQIDVGRICSECR